MKRNKYKECVILCTLSVIVFLLILGQIILSFFLLIKIISDVKKRPEKKSDIIISGLKSFNFTETSLIPAYDPSKGNLGLTGRVILDCYTGTCNKTEIEYGRLMICDIYDDDECEYKNYETIDFIQEIRKECSEDCFHFQQSNCNTCPNEYDSKIGSCSRKINDNYNVNKYCIASNVIYFWKGKRYEMENIKAFQIKTYTYLNNAKLKEEECPENTKNCGILDDNENKLCIPKDSECPINLISETKLNPNSKYLSTIIDNKTFYYIYDNTTNRKIIAGLYVDTDLFLKKKEEDFIILDTYNISGFLNENKNLFQEVDLGYDPYKINNIDEKGKSYLKVRYNAKKPDLIKMRKEYQNYVINNTINGKIIDSINNNYKFFMIGLVTYIFFFLLLLIFYIRGIVKKIVDIKFKKYIGFVIFLFFLFTLIALIRACINLNKLCKVKKIDKVNNYSDVRIINIIYIILGFILYPLIIGFLLYVHNYGYYLY